MKVTWNWAISKKKKTTTRSAIFACFCPWSLFHESIVICHFNRLSSVVQDQINVGSRIKHGDDDGARDLLSTNQKPAKRLWSVTGDTQGVQQKDIICLGCPCLELFDCFVIHRWRFGGSGDHRTTPVEMEVPEFRGHSKCGERCFYLKGQFFLPS